MKKMTRLKLRLLRNVILLFIADISIVLNVFDMYNKGFALASLEDVILIMLSLLVGVVGIADTFDIVSKVVKLNEEEEEF